MTNSEARKRAQAAREVVVEPLDLDAIRARVKSATEGPWAMERARHGTDILTVVTAPAHPTNDGSVQAVSMDAIPADADFIAHARADVPALLAEVERLRADLASSERDEMAAERRAIKAEAERDAARETLARVEALAKEHAECSGCPTPWWLRAALVQPTTDEGAGA